LTAPSDRAAVAIPMTMVAMLLSKSESQLLQPSLANAEGKKKKKKKEGGIKQLST